MFLVWDHPHKPFSRKYTTLQYYFSQPKEWRLPSIIIIDVFLIWDKNNWSSLCPIWIPIILQFNKQEGEQSSHLKEKDMEGFDLNEMVYMNQINSQLQV